jgi:hypothetical protein
VFPLPLNALSYCLVQQTHENFLSLSVADLNHFWGIYFHKNAKKLKILKRFLISPLSTSQKAQRSVATTAFCERALALKITMPHYYNRTVVMGHCVRGER